MVCFVYSLVISVSHLHFIVHFEIKTNCASDVNCALMSPVRAFV